ncbi:MAG: hypothetical protein ACI9TH_003517 [Kiritimatiellia bacterium]|jgi:hypothetical protein
MEATLYCNRCGRSGALELNDRVFCVDCYFMCNSCCHEFEGEDPLMADHARESF